MTTAKSWFHDETIARAIASGVWTVILQAPMALSLKLLFSGYQGLWNCIALLLHFGSIYSFFLIPVSVCGLTFMHLKLYKVEPEVYITRWALLREVLSPSFMLVLASYSTIGGVLMNSYFSTSVPFLGSLNTHCSYKEGFCLNEMHMFGVLFGGLLGLVESWNYYFSDRRLVRIPSIQQHVKVAVRANIPPLAKSALMLCAKMYLGYILLYFLFGGIVRAYVLSVTRVSLEDPLDTFVGVMNLGLAFRCIVIGSSCVFTMRVSNLLFQLYEIRPIALPVVRFAGDDTTPLLHEAMASYTPLLRLWACRDWSILAEQSAERRALIFSVSQPGNHPHNWNNTISAILPQCLSFIAELKGDLKGPKVENQEETTPPDVIQSPRSLDSLASPGRMRSMALKSPPMVVQQPAEKPKPSLQGGFQAKVQELVDNFKKKPIIAFLWGELPDAKRRQTFAKAEPIILLVEGLSHFVTASFTEDKYGVVQKDLSDILSMLLDLQAEMEVRGASSGMPLKRVETLTNPPADVRTKHRLKWAVKSSIYRIVVRFQRHIMNIPLPPSQKRMLEQYLEFRVG